MDAAQLKLSVIVISWNHYELLITLIDQLLRQDYPSRCYEIIVVDDGSTDGSREWLSGVNDPRIIAIIGECDQGRAASRNRGIRAATGDIIVMIDGDHTISDHFLSFHAERHARERCVIVGKSVFAEHPNYTALNHYLNGGGAAKMREDSALPGRYFLTRNCSVPRDVLQDVGLFDERFSAWGGEDLDLGMRLSSKVPIHGEPRALAVHHHFRDLESLMKNIYLYGKTGIPLLLEKHPQLFHELHIDRALSLPQYPSRYNGLCRIVLRGLMCSPFYASCKWLCGRLRSRKLPRVLFDYLHLRQYTRGYLDYLQTRGQ